MEELRTSLERVVSAGIRAYIGLLCAGEQERSRRVLSDTMQLSSLGAGGPSQRVRVSLFGYSDRAGDDDEGAVTPASSLARVLAFFTLRSLLASLLVLRASAYWRRVPELEELQTACAVFNRCLGSGAGSEHRALSGCEHEEDHELDDGEAGCPCGGGSWLPWGPTEGVAAAGSGRGRPM